MSKEKHKKFTSIYYYFKTAGKPSEALYERIQAQ